MTLTIAVAPAGTVMLRELDWLRSDPLTVNTFTTGSVPTSVSPPNRKVVWPFGANDARFALVALSELNSDAKLMGVPWATELPAPTLGAGGIRLPPNTAFPFGTLPC
jgi:hypothetical protein